MALPFRVFDYHRYDEEHGRAYCLRCEDWVEALSPFSGSLDPHIEDHLHAWMMLDDLHRSRMLTDLYPDGMVISMRGNEIVRVDKPEQVK